MFKVKPFLLATVILGLLSPFAANAFVPRNAPGLHVKPPVKATHDKVKFTLDNNGGTTAGNFTTTVELGEINRNCADNLSKCGPINYQQQCSFSTEQLPLTESVSYACEYGDQTKPDRTYAIRIKVDADNEIEELNEENNVVTETLDAASPESETTVSITPDQIVIHRPGEKKEIRVEQGTPKTAVRQGKESVEVEQDRVSFESPQQKRITVRTGKDKATIESKGVKAETDLELKVENRQLKANTKKGEKEVKIKPDQARDKTKGKLSMKVKEMNLKESRSGQLSYEVQGSKKGKLFGFIPVTQRISAEVDANTGRVQQTKKPWWSFIAF